MVKNESGKLENLNLSHVKPLIGNKDVFLEPVINNFKGSNISIKNEIEDSLKKFKENPEYFLEPVWARNEEEVWVDGE